MVQPIIKGESVLRLPSVADTADDLQVAQDLLDTLAANMIGAACCADCTIVYRRFASV